MISQEYINLLSDLWPDNSINIDEMWNITMAHWKDKGSSERRLIKLAEIVYTKLSDLRNVPFVDCIIRAKQLHAKKNAGYSGSDPDPWANFRQCESFGVPVVDGCIARMCDKYSRYCRLRENPDNEQVGESITDTLEDLGAYALILVCLLREN